jgi:hypothetical protein
MLIAAFLGLLILKRFFKFAAIFSHANTFDTI